MSARVCMLVSYHPFLDARIFHREAKSLLKKGYRVTIVAPRKNGYLFDIDGSLFKDKFRERKFVHEGIEIVTYDPQKERESFKQMRDNIRLKKIHSFSDPLFKTGLKQKADIYHAHEFGSLYSGVGIKRALRKKGKDVKLIFDSHELVVDPLRKTTKKKKEMLFSMLKRMLKETDYMITVSKSIKDWYKNELKVSLPIEVVYNSPPLNKDYQQKQYDLKMLTVCYEGNIFSYKGSFEKIARIAEQCRQATPFRFKIIGGASQGSPLSIPPHLRQTIQSMGWTPFESIPAHMKDADLGWIDMDLSNSLNRRYAMPNKFFSYLNNGLPVLVNNCLDIKKFIKKYKCGVVIEKDDPTPEDYVEKILELRRNPERLRQMSRNARRAMEKKYCWEQVEKRLIKVYDRLSRKSKKKKKP